MFRFTFNIGGIDGLNPFSGRSEEHSRIQQAAAPQTLPRKLPPPPRRPMPSSSLSDSEPLSGKRGWTPGLSSPSTAISQPALTNGWLDTPSRYLDAASRSRDNVVEAELDGELPPTKRRKTLADSIIGTALSAGLIGTAVGMTAYRMWRDRGKTIDASLPGESVEQPPPPYEEQGRVEEATQAKISSPTPRTQRKARTITRRTPRRRMAPVIISPARSPHRAQHPPIFATLPSESAGSERGNLDEQMDWMSDKIRELIEEGQKALGKEVVLMCDVSDGDDAVDDGSEGWEEVDENNSQISTSSLKRPNILGGPSRSSRDPSITPSVASPVQPSLTLPGSFVNSSKSPRSKRSRPYVVAPKQGTANDGNNDMKILYEPVTAISNLEVDNVLDDDDSRALNERMERIRHVYKIQ